MTYELRVERVLNASAEEVFEAYTDAEAAKVWFRLGPDGPDDSIVEITNDLRVGGEWNAAWGQSADQLFRERGVYQVVDPPRRLVMAHTGWTPDGQTMDTTIEVTFEDLGGKTRMVVTQSVLSGVTLRVWPRGSRSIQCSLVRAVSIVTRQPIIRSKETIGIVTSRTSFAVLKVRVCRD